MKLPAKNDNHAAPNAARSPGHHSTLVVIRFLTRMAILTVFATLGSQRFPETFAALLAMGALYCVIIASIRREAPFGPALTHFDEAAAYAVLRACRSLGFVARHAAHIGKVNNLHTGGRFQPLHIPPL